jgi:hypothetical protein
MKEKYPIEPTEKQLEVMKLYWAMLQEELNNHYVRVAQLEMKMWRDTGINDLMFFQCDGDYVGIGDVNRTMKLIQQEELKQDES